MSSVQLQNITKKYDDTIAVNELSLTINDGEFFSLLGPSGCGKTTILRMIAGFIIPTTGRILFNNRDVSILPPNKRNAGMVFQNYALFPHMTVFENVAFGLRVRKISKHECRDRVNRALELVNLPGFGDRKVTQLSGGQQQRVALARAIVIEPQILLLDEPLSNLDAKLRRETRDQIQNLQQKLGITTIYVTHDQEEALTTSDRIAVLDRGICQQIGTPYKIYSRPANAFVASFLGRSNLLRGKVREKDGFIELENGLMLFAPEKSDQGDVVVSIRPETVIMKDADDGRTNTFEGVVRHRQFNGYAVEYEIDVQGIMLNAVELNQEEHILDVNDRIYVELPVSKINIIPVLSRNNQT